MYIQENSVKMGSLVNQHVCCIIFREASSGPVFGNEIEKKRFLDILLKARQISDAEIYAYCILDRVSYILAGVGQKDSIRLTTEQVKEDFEACYRKAYPREQINICCEFQWMERLTWERIAAGCARLQQLPVLCLRVAQAEDYWWSSLKEYLLRYRSGIIRPEFLLEVFDSDRRRAVLKMKKFQKAWCTETGNRI